MPPVRMFRTASLVLVVVLPLLAFCAAGTARADDPLHAGPPFLISSPALDDYSPATAHNPYQHLFVVVWQKAGAVKGRVVSEQGALLYAEFVVNGAFNAENGSSPAVAYNSATETFLIVWNQYVESGPPHMDIYAWRLPGDGWGGEGAFWVSSTGSTNGPEIAANSHDGEFLVVWEDGRTVYGQRVAGGGGGGSNLLGGAIRVAQGSVGPGLDIGYLEPDVAYNGSQNRFLVVFTRNEERPASSRYDILGRLVEASGAISAWPTTIEGASFDQYQPAVAACPLDPARPFLVVFEDEYDDPPDTDITALWLDANGVPALGALCIACSSTIVESKPDVAGSDGFGYTVVWQEVGLNANIWGRRVSPDATLQEDFPVTAPPNAQWAPAIDGGSPVALVVFEDYGWGSGTSDIAGRILGYQVQLPATMR